MKRTKEETRKTAVYDQEIRPLMAQILTICKENRISFAAQFMLSKRDWVTSATSYGNCKPHIKDIRDAMMRYTEVDENGNEHTYGAIPCRHTPEGQKDAAAVTSDNNDCDE